ncbi:hypothetical protein PMAYCL1PPCAC_20773, partial [Pristionchus mayeri]
DEEEEEEAPPAKAVPAKKAEAKKPEPKKPEPKAAAKKEEPKAAAKKEEPKAAAKKEEPAAAPKRKIDVSEVVSDQERRREEEHKKTLFVKGFDRSFDEEKLKKLHALIIGVRRRSNKSNFAWVIFASEANANKAYPELSKIKGLTVDYCGQKSKAHMALIEAKSTERPIDPTLLCVRGISGEIKPEELKTIFKAATDVKIPNVPKSIRGKTDRYALIRFENEAEAKAVFDANKNLKINGSQATVMYAFAKAKPTEKAEKPAKKTEAEKKKAATPAKKQVVQEESDDDEDDDDDDDDEEIPSSDEGIEEEDEEEEEEPPKKKAALIKPPPAKKGKVAEPEPESDDEDDEDDEDDDDEEDDDDDEEEDDE